MTKIRNFRDLSAWEEAHRLVLVVYKITRRFPSTEIYGLTAQLKRAAISVTSNIAEGFSRFYYKDKNRFYYNARGSLSEIQSQLIVAKDLKFVTDEEFKNIWSQSEKVIAILNGLIRKTEELAEK